MPRPPRQGSPRLGVTATPSRARGSPHQASPPSLSRADLSLPLRWHRPEPLEAWPPDDAHRNPLGSWCRCRFPGPFSRFFKRISCTWKFGDALSSFSADPTFPLCYRVNNYRERKPSKSKIRCSTHLLDDVVVTGQFT